MDNIYEGRNVKELIKKDFRISQNNVFLNKKLTGGLNGILVVYAPWCENCQLSKDMWLNLARLFKYKFNVYALNTYNFRDNNQDLILPLDVEVFPEYRFVNKNGEIIKYEGEKKESEIIKFIIKNM